MANVQSGNVWYVDSTGSLTVNGSVRVIQIVLSPSSHGSGSPLITLQDQSQSNNTKITVATPNTTTAVVPFLKPLEFFGGIKVSTLNGAVATIIIEQVGG